MLAPIALYPDPLLSQILMASTYPLEVVEAARWSRANPNLGGDQAVRAVERKDWDPSVKSLVAFPQILTMMDQKLEWTERLGDAFLDQQPEVMDTVQRLRQRAYAAGNLRSNDHIRVTPQAQFIVVEPAHPRIVYVPYYDPMIVYGPWWWPAYPPVYWAPWPGYYVRPGVTVSFLWGSGTGISTGFFFGAFDWHRHHARVVRVNNYYYNRTVIVNHQTNAPHVTRNVNAAPGVWRHDPDHRRGVPYREASLRHQFGRTGASPQGGRDFRGRDGVAAGGSQTARPDARGGDARAGTDANTHQDTRSQDNNRSSDARRGAAHRPDARVNSRRDDQRTAVSRPEARSEDNHRSDPLNSSGSRPAARVIDRRDAPRSSNAGAEIKFNNRPDVRNGRVSRPDARANNQPDAPGIPSSRPEAGGRHPMVERQPNTFEGAGHGTDARNSGSRGRFSSAFMASDQKSSSAPRPPADASIPRSSGHGHGAKPSDDARNDGKKEHRRK